MPMRKSLWWALGGTLALTAASLWATRQAPTLVAAAVRAGDAPAPADERPLLQAAPGPARWDRATPAGPLPAQWPAQALEPAKRDIFQPVLPPAPPPPPAPKPVPVVAPPPPAPMAPPMNYRFFGRMLTPEGASIVYLVKGTGVPIEVAVDQRLDDGYVVESITDQAVQLVYPPLGQRATIGIAPPPQ